jgi:osmotically-inducible protein OsmY
MAAKAKQMAESDLRHAVLASIRQQTQKTESDIGVTFDRGVVILSGQVDNDVERAAVEAAAKHLPGVQAIVSDLRIKQARERSDEAIARDALVALKNQGLIPADATTVIVRDGSVFLEGEVHLELQRMLAEASIRQLRGIKSVSNHIAVKKVKGAAVPELAVESQILPNGGSPAQADENASCGTNEWSEIGDAEPG